MFLEDIYLISKIFAILLNGSSGFVSPIFSQIDEIYKNNMFNIRHFAYFLHPGVSKDKNSWFWESGTRPEIPKS